MVGRRRTKTHHRKFAASHQRSWLWGRHAVREALAAGRWLPREVHLSDRNTDAERDELQQLAARHRVTVAEHPYEQLTQWCGTTEHQGFMARMGEYPYLSLVDGLAAEKDATPLWLVLDRIQDPFNFGAILRSAEVLGADGVIIGSREQSAVTPHVARSSAGAVHHLSIVRVDDLYILPQQLKEHGLNTVATAGTATQTVSNSNLRQPTALFIGNEGTGIADELLNQCDETILIPQQGHIESLNAAVAAGIVLYEAMRQRR